MATAETVVEDVATRPRSLQAVDTAFIAADRPGGPPANTEHLEQFMGQAEKVARMFRVTSTNNRLSIMENGLDWRRMGASRGIAGSTAREQEGCFLCLDEFDVDYFVSMNNTGGPVDVWAVEGVDGKELLRSPEGYLYVPAAVPPTRLQLVRRDVPPREGKK